MDNGALLTWIEISAGAHRHNLEAVRRLVGPEVELAAVVKANAYGHGWRVVAEMALAHGADSFCVHSLDEALDLRQAGFHAPILVMGPVADQRLDEALASDLRLVLFDLASARALAERARSFGRRARVHLKLETGTYRQGVDLPELSDLLEFLRAHPELEVEGAYTHFANIEDTTEHLYAKTQLERFGKLLDRVEQAIGRPMLRHAACSAAIVLFPETHFDMVRLGISQYGLFSSRETALSYQGRADAEKTLLRPVLSWRTRVGQIKDVPADAFIGYGCTYQTTRASRIAILPIGYSDGFARSLSNVAWVLIRGRRAPVRGRICMNLMMVDVTDIADVARGDEVVLIGRQGEQEISAGTLANLAGTIHYELLSRLSPQIPRLLVD